MRLSEDDDLVPPQNPVHRAMIDVSALRDKVPNPDASRAVRPARDRPIEPESIDEGKVIALPMAGELHHRYTRRAA